MQNHYFAMLSRMKNIYRWGLMRNTKAENLSEHSLEVAYFAHALALIRNSLFGGNVNPERAAVKAMFHDTTEILTGDLPTPIKYYNPEIRSASQVVEAEAADRLLEMLPDELRQAYAQIYHDDDPALARIVKAADKLSALIKCIEEAQMGNREFVSAENATRKALSAMQMPEVDYFIKTFLPSYSLTLDEQRESK